MNSNPRPVVISADYDFKSLVLLLAIVCFSPPTSVIAGIVTIDFGDTGPVTSIEGFWSDLGFAIDEGIGVSIQFDDTVTDSNPNAGVARYNDPNGVLILEGLTTGTVFTYDFGTEIGELYLEFDDSHELEIGATDGQLFRVSDIDVDDRDESEGGQFGDIENLANVLTTFSGGSFANDTDLEAAIRNLNTGDDMDWGPVAVLNVSTGSSVPEPSSFLCLTLMGLAFGFRSYVSSRRASLAEICPG